MKAKVLYSVYLDGTGLIIHRVYPPVFYEQAQSDFNMMQIACGDSKDIYLKEVELFTKNENE